MTPVTTEIHIQVLRCVLDHGPISISEIEGKLGLAEGSLRWVNEEGDTGGQSLWRQKRNEGNEWLYVLSMAGRQILLDHDLLELTRRSSRNAMIIAILALLISAAALVVSTIH